MFRNKKQAGIIIISSLLIAVFLNIPFLWGLFSRGGTDPQFFRRLVPLTFNILSSFVLALVLFQFNLKWKYTKIPVLDKLFSKWVVLIIVNVIIAIVLTYIFKEIDGFDPPRRGRFMLRYGAIINVSSIVVIVMLISRLLEVLLKNQQVALENEQLKSENLQSQFSALKNQLDPHFLFNSLNTILELIEEDKELAKGFVTRLSEVFRYVLSHSDKPLITLKEEVNFSKDYVYLLKLRHGQLSVQFELVESETEWKVPPLAIQLLIENAVKHNEISKQNPLQIKVTQIGDLLEVSNVINVKRTKADGAGMGLKNMSERYRIIADKQIQIESNLGVFKVIIPLLKVD